MTEQGTVRPGGAARGAKADYRLQETAEALNDRLGLYLSEEQQRGLAAGLLVGAAVGAAIVAWGIAETVRRRA
jgi:hypothetical protein